MSTRVGSGRGPATLALAVLGLAAAPGVSLGAAANSGKPGSTCQAKRLAGTIPAGLSATGLGRLPAPYEIGAPRTGRVARVMMLVHGGAWYEVGRGAMATMRAAAAAWRAAGWETVNVDYRACGASSRDVLAAYDAIRRRVGRRMPICITGASAGGQLALMVAAERADVSCVVSAAGPTDLQSIAAQGGSGGRVMRNWAIAAFGTRRLAAESPVRRAAHIHARLLLVGTQDDVLVPFAQARELARRMGHRYVATDDLAPGRVPFVHGTASPAALSALARQTARLVAPVGGSPLESRYPGPERQPPPTLPRKRLRVQQAPRLAATMGLRRGPRRHHRASAGPRGHRPTRPR